LGYGEASLRCRRAQARFERQASLGRRLADRVVGDVRALEWVDARTLLYTAGAKADAESPVMRLDVGSGKATPWSIRRRYAARWSP
jgi:hypothetical protein